MKFLLYGAYGYTGQLIVEMAAGYGLTPILAGRSADKLRPLAEQYGLDWRAFDLTDQTALHAALRETPAVLHAAGPFMHTARPMIEACLATGVHYLDITGEITVFEMAHRYDAAARERGIMVMPGVGFDVVPTDCLASFLKAQLPDATHLKLAFSALGGGVSRGTARTMAENLGQPGAIRRNGKITPVPVGYKTLQVPFRSDLTRFAVTIPWGDVSTAYYTTGIPNIETYMTIRPSAYKWFKAQRYFGWLLRQPWLRRLAKQQIDRGPAGPNAERREAGQSLVWGQVTNANGKQVSARLQAPEGYTLTAITSLIIMRRVLEGQAPAGFHTPAGAYGADLILEAPGASRELI